MAAAVAPTDVQKMEFDVTTAEGPCRVTVVTGMLTAGLVANSGTQSLSLTALVDPTLSPGQFRKATATAAYQADNFHFALNLKTAKALGLTLPTSILLRADEVIE